MTDSWNKRVFATMVQTVLEQSTWILLARVLSLSSFSSGTGGNGSYHRGVAVRARLEYQEALTRETRRLRGRGTTFCSAMERVVDEPLDICV